MDQRFTFLGILFFCIIAIGCKERQIVTTYETGEKYEEYQYTGDSLKHGVHNIYHVNGNIQEESKYINGKLDGTRKLYDTNGALEITETYTDGVLNGAFNTYHPSGKVRLEGNYNNNVLEGLVKGYYPTGELMEEVVFVDNREDGPFKEYHENGNVKWEGTYKKGDNEFGLLQEYNESGTLIRKMMCDENAICTTTWTIDGSHLEK